MQPIRYVFKYGLNGVVARSSKKSVSLQIKHFRPLISFQKRNFNTGHAAQYLVSPRNHQISAAESINQANSPSFLNVSPVNDDFMLKIKWKDGNHTKYPYVWLRDNCQCPQCFHPTTRSRRVLLQDLDTSITVQTVKINDANELEILWSDQHTGIYPDVWLQERSFTKPMREKRERRHRFNRSYWGSEMINRLKKAQFNDLMNEDEALRSFLSSLEEFGLVLVQGTPSQTGEIIRLSKRVGYLKKTHYGDTFIVKQKIDANNLAYTSDFLNIHVDLPYLSYKPGVQLLHCIAQVPGTGGANHLVDSFHVANLLRERYPEKFDLLATTIVDFVDHGVEEDGSQFDTHNQEPTIVLDNRGLVNTINLNQMVRDSHFDMPVDKVKDWYDAMLTFHDLLYHPDNLITHKMSEGDIIVFDNNRVMHGRTGYTMTEGSRQLEGCYWDWDMIKSCRRVLESKLGLSL